MTDTITMPRAEYDETTAQLRYQAREIERLRAIAERLDEAELENAESRAAIVDLRDENARLHSGLKELSATVEELKVKYVQPNVDASTHAMTEIERAVARLAKIKGEA